MTVEQQSLPLVVIPRCKVHVRKDRYGLFYIVTVEHQGKKALTTLGHRPTEDDPTIIKIKRGFAHA